MKKVSLLLLCVMLVGCQTTKSHEQIKQEISKLTISNGIKRPGAVLIAQNHIYEQNEAIDAWNIEPLEVVRGNDSYEVYFRKKDWQPFLGLSFVYYVYIDKNSGEVIDSGTTR